MYSSSKYQINHILKRIEAYLDLLAFDLFRSCPKRSKILGQDRSRSKKRKRSKKISLPNYHIDPVWTFKWKIRKVRRDQTDNMHETEILISLVCYWHNPDKNYITELRIVFYIVRQVGFLIWKTNKTVVKDKTSNVPATFNTAERPWGRDLGAPCKLHLPSREAARHNCTQSNLKKYIIHLPRSYSHCNHLVFSGGFCRIFLA